MTAVLPSLFQRFGLALRCRKSRIALIKALFAAGINGVLRPYKNILHQCHDRPEVYASSWQTCTAKNNAAVTGVHSNGEFWCDSSEQKIK
jgi:hypothetical protein